MIIPPINLAGQFTVSPPFDSRVEGIQKYTVVSIRGLDELSNSNENPLDNIYTSNGLTISDYDADFSNNVPIVVLVSTSNNYIYVPANRILTMPSIVGHKYQEKILAINLGSIPLDLNLETLKESLILTTLETVGITTDIKEVASSAVILVNDVDDNTFRLTTDAKKASTMSFKTKYEQEVVINDKLRTTIGEFECFILAKSNDEDLCG